MLEFGTFLRAVNDRPYEWMTIGCPEFDGDSHESSAHWFGMTRSDGAPIAMTGNSIARQIPIYRNVALIP